MQQKGVIFEGRTLDDAVKKGLEALGLSRAEVMINVLEDGSGGFLGIGARPYKVRMMPRPRRELGDRPAGHEGERGADRGRDRGRRPSRGEARSAGRREGRGQGRSDGRARPAATAAGAAAPREERGTGPVQPERERAPRRRGRGRPGASGAPHVAAPQARGNERTPPRPPAPAPEDAPAAIAEPVGGTAEGPLMGGDELCRTAVGLTETMLQAMGFAATVSAHGDGETVEVKAEVPEGSDLLLGHKGEVRQAMQHILNRMLNRGQGSRYHLQLEINDFWQRREEELQGLARRLAEEALAERAEKLTEYLNSQERRIVHVTLREDARVKTYAIGDGLIKKVAVAPADFPEGSKDGT